jgi:hypothetical protein
MRTRTLVTLLVVAAVSIACATLATDPINSITAFNPYVTKDGVQSFRFVAKNKLPSYLEGQDIRKVHETLISNELGKRQYCMHGYEIVSVTSVGSDNLLYEGICKQ